MENVKLFRLALELIHQMGGDAATIAGAVLGVPERPVETSANNTGAAVPPVRALKAVEPKTSNEAVEEAKKIAEKYLTKCPACGGALNSRGSCPPCKQKAYNAKYLARKKAAQKQ